MMFLLQNDILKINQDAQYHHQYLDIKTNQDEGIAQGFIGSK